MKSGTHEGVYVTRVDGRQQERPEVRPKMPLDDRSVVLSGSLQRNPIGQPVVAQVVEGLAGGLRKPETSSDLGNFDLVALEGEEGGKRVFKVTMRR